MEKKKRVAGRGEILLRLTSEKGRQRKNADHFSVCYGGAEGNVLRSLSCLGRDTRLLTKLGNDEISFTALLTLKRVGVDSSFIVRDDNPLGLYFFEEGEGRRPSKVVYHRKDSSATTRKPSDFDFDKALLGVDLFHVSGISLCLSKTRTETVIECLKACKRKGIPISFDFNYRSTLLPLAEAQKVYPEVAKLSTYIFASKWDIQNLLGFGKDREEDKVFSLACQEYGFRYIFNKKRVVINDRHHRRQCFAYDGKEKFTGREEDRLIFDRIGAGDAFAAGVLYGLLTDRKPKEVLDFGIANCALEQSIFGDHANFSAEEVQEYLNSTQEERIR